jgi:hypothetical protein
VPGAATTALSRRLGGPSVRRRRHRRFALAAGALLVLALGLIVLGGNGDDFEDDATATCQHYAERVQDEFRLSFPEGVPSDAAFAEYTSHAFADTMEELLDELDALDPPSDVAELVGGYRAVVADLRANPEEFVTVNPFAELATRFDDEGLPACGSDFFATLRSPE